MRHACVVQCIIDCSHHHYYFSHPPPTFVTNTNTTATILLLLTQLSPLLLVRCAKHELKKTRVRKKTMRMRQTNTSTCSPGQSAKRCTDSMWRSSISASHRGGGTTRGGAHHIVQRRSVQSCTHGSTTATAATPIAVAAPIRSTSGGRGLSIHYRAPSVPVSTSSTPL